MQQNIEKYIIDKEELSAVRKGEKMAARFKKHPFLDYQILNLIQSGLEDINIVITQLQCYICQGSRFIL